MRRFLVAIISGAMVLVGCAHSSTQRTGSQSTSPTTSARASTSASVSTTCDEFLDALHETMGSSAVSDAEEHAIFQTVASSAHSTVPRDQQLISALDTLALAGQPGGPTTGPEISALYVTVLTRCRALGWRPTPQQTAQFNIDLAGLKTRSGLSP
jgi:hypothetical protein